MTELVIPNPNRPAGIETEPVRLPRSPDTTRHVLVVVDEPCTSPELCAGVRSNAGGRPTEALLIAPTHGSARTRWYVDEDAARVDATQRLRACAACLRAEGIRAEGRLGDPDPVQAISDALHVYAADEIQIITAPQRPSTWLHQNVIDRARRSFEQPIKHVVVPTMQSATSPPLPAANERQEA